MNDGASRGPRVTLPEDQANPYRPPKTPRSTSRTTDRFRPIVTLIRAVVALWGLFIPRRPDSVRAPLSASVGPRSRSRCWEWSSSSSRSSPSALPEKSRSKARPRSSKTSDPDRSRRSLIALRKGLPRRAGFVLSKTLGRLDKSCPTRIVRSWASESIAVSSTGVLGGGASAADDRGVTGEVLADISRHLTSLGDPVFEEFDDLDEFLRQFARGRGDDLVRLELLVDREQGLAVLGGALARDDGELERGGEEVVERDEALTGGGRGLFEDQVDGLDGRPGPATRSRRDRSGHRAEPGRSRPSRCPRAWRCRRRPSGGRSRLRGSCRRRKTRRLPRSWNSSIINPDEFDRPDDPTELRRSPRTAGSGRRSGSCSRRGRR